ncbi:MAG: hypothetical protein RI897_3500 [Verrucomicrobiota bacterium]
MVEDEVGVGGVDVELGVEVGEADVGDADFIGEVLEFAVSVGDADGADVVSFGEEEFDDHFPVEPEFFCIGEDDLVGGDWGGAGGEEFGCADDFDDAESAGADFGDAFEEAEGGDLDVIFAADIEDSAAGFDFEFPAVDRDGDRFGHGDGV